MRLITTKLTPKKKVHYYLYCFYLLIFYVESLFTSTNRVYSFNMWRTATFYANSCSFLLLHKMYCFLLYIEFFFLYYFDRFGKLESLRPLEHATRNGGGDKYRGAETSFGTAGCISEFFSF